MSVLTFAEMLEESNTRVGGIYKWARVQPAGAEADPEVFRFIRLVFNEQHSMMVEPGEKALAAGTIITGRGFWKTPGLGGWGSYTLKIGCDQRHADDLASALQAAGRERTD